ncbi:MAG: phage tail sheath family protein, partial [Desulfobacterales bacterium]|nr:phage tail sheath family protein [Desulfobacterales bacterium]
AAGDPLLGNVGNLEKVTIDDLNRLFDEAQVPAAASADPETGVLVLSTTENPGPGAVIIAAGPAAVALGLTNPCTPGSAAAGPGYYTKDDQGWIGAADAAYLDAGVEPPPGAWLVTMNIHVEDADGAAIIHEEVGFGGAHPRYLGHVLSENPTLGADALSSPFFVSIQGTVDAATLRNGIFGPDASDATFRLTGGHDGAEPAAASTAGSTPGSAASYEKALEALEDIEDISIVAAPGHNAESGADLTPYRAVQELLIGHAERMRYRIAVLDPPRGVDLAQIRQIRGFIDTTYAALYYPWIVIANPLARPGDQSIPREIPLPPSGFITGIYARNDVHRGVWKAPANEVIRGAIRFETEINHRQQEALNPEGINCLRFFFGRGNRVWGARTASSDPEWKYVNVRRCFIYLERSIDRSTQWAVFEPNGERLWANIRETVSAFLYNEWKRGALLGSKPEEAYFVRCDRSTMTQNDLDNGRLICEIGVAALYPAEFVIFRIGQKTADARS